MFWMINVDVDFNMYALTIGMINCYYVFFFWIKLIKKLRF